MKSRTEWNPRRQFIEPSHHARLMAAGWSYRTNADRGWIVYCDPATGLWHPEKEAVAIKERSMESQRTERCNDPQVGLCSVTTPQ